jgi:hypothetical protein
MLEDDAPPRDGAEMPFRPLCGPGKKAWVAVLNNVVRDHVQNFGDGPEMLSNFFQADLQIYGMIIEIAQSA